MKILVTGSDGLVGRNIIPILEKDFEITAATEKEWDITDAATGGRIISRVRPDVVLNLAAMTDVDRCEDQGGLATWVNAEAPRILAGLARCHGARLIQFSTDYVFDGTKRTPYREEDQMSPLCIYGLTKSLGELAVLEENPRSLIIRTEWVYGSGGTHFISKILSVAREKGGVDVVNDQTGSPTFARDLAEPIAALLRRNASGIFHVSNSGACTWFQFAKEIFSILSMDVRCSPINSGASARKARRPCYSVLDLGKLRRETGIVMRNWREALSEYLKETARQQALMCCA